MNEMISATSETTSATLTARPSWLKEPSGGFRIDQGSLRPKAETGEAKRLRRVLGRSDEKFRCSLVPAPVEQLGE
jgi:hypothetical protein